MKYIAPEMEITVLEVADILNNGSNNTEDDEL